MEYIKNNERSYKKYIIEDLKLTEGQVKHAIKTLKENNEIKSVGKGKNTYYVTNDEIK